MIQKTKPSEPKTLFSRLNALGYKMETYKLDQIRVFDSTGRVVSHGNSVEVWEWLRKIEAKEVK
jgi:hypothetical protein